MSHVPRVTQLDSLLLDRELQNLVKNQVANVIQAYKGGALLVKYGAEVQLVIKLIIWRLSVYRRNASVGQALLGIKYVCDKSRLRLLFLLDTLAPYLYAKVVLWLRRKGISRKVERCLTYVEDGIKICEILNFLTFLMRNRYPSLVHRILTLQMSPAFGVVHPSVGYSYQLREMLWHQFADFLMVVLPIINIHRIKRYLSKWGFSSSSPRALSQVPAAQTVGAISRDATTVVKCCLCKADAVLPQNFDNCTFCYYCLKANSVADSDFRSNSCIHAG